MFNKAEGPGNTGLPLVVNTPGWVKGLLIYYPRSFSFQVVELLVLVYTPSIPNQESNIPFWDVTN